MRRTAALALGLALAAAAALPAGASGTQLVGPQLDRTTVRAGQTIKLTGSMEVTAQPGVTRLWTDGTLVGDLTQFQYPVQAMTDLVEGSVERARPGDPLTLRIKVAPAVGAEPGPLPYQWYRWPFQIGDRWYFVEFTYVQGGTAFDWRGSWYYCRLALGSNCVHGTTPAFPMTWDAATRTLTGRIPIRDLGAVQGDGILPQDIMRPFSSQYPPESGLKTPGITIGQDRAPAFNEFLLPVESVFLGIAPRGTSEDAVQYKQKAQPNPTAGSLTVPFSTEIATEALAPGDYDLWVKGCFGPCDVQVLPFTVTS